MTQKILIHFRHWVLLPQKQATPLYQWRSQSMAEYGSRHTNLNNNFSWAYAKLLLRTTINHLSSFAPVWDTLATPMYMG